MSNLARPNDTRYAFWFIGGTDPEIWDEAERKGDLMALPLNHSSKFVPVVEPTIRTGGAGDGDCGVGDIRLEGSYCWCRG